MAQDPVFDWWSVIIVLGIVQGVIISIALFLNLKKRPALIMLALLILVLVWHHLQSISIYLNFFREFPHFYGADLGSLFLIGPLFYLYIKLVTCENGKLVKWDTLHSLPFFITIIAHPAIFLPGDEKVELILDWLTAIRYDNPHLRQAFLLDDIIFVLESIHMLVYFVLAITLLKKYAYQRKQYVSSLHQTHYQWLTVISILVVIVISVSFILQKTLYVQLKYYYYSLDYIYILPMTIFIYVIGFYALKSPLLFSHNLDFKKIASKYSSSSLTDNRAEEYREQIENYMEREKPYLNPEITLPELADALELPANHLSQVINDKFGLNFFDFINQYRIDEIKRRFADSQYKNDKLLKIALESGFNNKVSFNRYFKKIVGETPSTYRKKIEN